MAEKVAIDDDENGGTAVILPPSNDENDNSDENENDIYDQFRDVLCCVFQPSRSGEMEIIYDFTSHIVVPTYNVRTQPEWNEWTDGNFEVHRQLKRLTTSGSFTLYYDDPEELNDMLGILREYGINNRDDNGITLYAKTIEGSINAAITPEYTPTEYGDVAGTFALSYTLRHDIPYYGRKAHDGVEIQITNKLYGGMQYYSGR